MARWEPDGRGRLEQAALELFGERGFEATTVAEIAARAGLTERTFFRHYADKREVLFWGQSVLHDVLVDAIAAAPDPISPIDAVATAIEAAAAALQERREIARRRHAVIAANPSLQERELIKLATLASDMAEALRARGVGDTVAELTAEIGIAVFKVAFVQWIGETGQPNFARVIRASLEQLRTVTAVV